MGWKSQSLEKMASKAYNEGLKQSNTKGRLSKYITKLFFESQVANQVRIYCETIFLFKGNILITLYQIPNNLKKLTHKQ